MPAQARRAVILRRVVVLRGEASLAFLLDVRSDWGRRGCSGLRRDEQGIWTGPSATPICG